MQVVNAALAVLAIGGASTMLGHVSTSSGTAPELCATGVEVVYSMLHPGCEGCQPIVTDSAAGGVSYQCPNGDVWTLLTQTPTPNPGECVRNFYACVIQSGCRMRTEGTLTLIPNGDGSCALTGQFVDYETGERSDEFDLQNGTSFVLESSIDCEPGSSDTAQCEHHIIEFFNDTEAQPVIRWQVDHCCTRCPE